MLESSFHEDARAEFDEAADFYGMELASLGLAFVDAVEAAVAHVRVHPDYCPVSLGRVRKVRVRRFPYSVMYSVVEDRIRVLAAHEMRSDGAASGAKHPIEGPPVTNPLP